MTSSEITESDDKDLSGFQKDNPPDRIDVEGFVTNAQVITEEQQWPLWRHICGKRLTLSQKRSKQQMDNLRIQIDVSPEKLAELEELMQVCGVKTKKELINNALVLLQWAVRQVRSGRTVASVDEKEKRYRDLEMPILSTAAGKKWEGSPQRLASMNLPDFFAFIQENADRIIIIPLFVNGAMTMVEFSNLGTIGNLNFQGVQLAESINVKIDRLKEQDGNDDIANALKELTTAIDKATLPDEQRNDLLEQVELLGDQASLPKEKRKKGLIKPVIDSIAGVCAGAGGLAVAWQLWQPVIMRFFGM
jgi:hypothetical protein